MRDLIFEKKATSIFSVELNLANFTKNTFCRVFFNEIKKLCLQDSISAMKKFKSLYCSSSVSIVGFEQVNICWDHSKI